ncbi:helicase associated domain-containing protein [Peterkaempfera sp. SMS 1(5)a]|uniref:helicase associated domain-containing protein n=1 Tax=Peterkaempfera podocarpi TaxID=3232308 RepID=UPI003671B469
MGVRPAQAPPGAPAANGRAKSGAKAQQAFQRGLAALAQYVAREGHHRVPRTHAEALVVEGEAGQAVIKLGVWVSNTKARRDKLTPEQLDALRQLGVQWA